MSIVNKRTPFTKMTGVGNDFIVIDDREVTFKKPKDMGSFVRKVCNRNFGVGADGLLIIEKSQKKDADAVWHFFNADGGTAEMCGNAARCVSRFLFDHGVNKKTVGIKTEAGVVRGTQLARGVVEVEMTKPRIISESLDIATGVVRNTVFLVDTGVPHAVFPITDWDPPVLEEWGSHLQEAPEFEKFGGANITFVEAIDDGHLESATFERGVRAVTLACGTGAVAAAYYAFKKGKTTQHVEVAVPGGTLHVRWEGDFEKVFLSGEARYICEGFLSEEVLL